MSGVIGGHGVLHECSRSDESEQSAPGLPDCIYNLGIGNGVGLLGLRSLAHAVD